MRSKLCHCKYICTCGTFRYKNVHSLYHNMYYTNKISVVDLSVGMVLNCFPKTCFRSGIRQGGRQKNFWGVSKRVEAKQQGVWRAQLPRH